MQKPRHASQSGEATVIVLVVLAVVGAAVLLFKPKKLDGESNRAQDSVVATANVEKSFNAQGASAAASVSAIGEANTEAPDSPSKDFISREVPVVLSKLPKADPTALVAAEARKAAVMQGQRDLATKLYSDESQKTAKLTKDLNEALEARRRADSAISEAAAANLALERQGNLQKAGLALLVVLVIYIKVFGISTSTIGKAVADIRSGVDPIQALDTHLAPWHHAKVRIASQLATNPVDKND